MGNCKEFDIGSGRAEKGNLVTVNDNGKNDDLKLLLEMAYPKKEQDSNRWADTRWVWAGLRKTKNNELKKPGKYNALDWEWADGSNPETYFKWMNWGKKNEQPDQRTLVEGNQGCDESPRCYQNQMRINHEGEWDDTWKFKTHPYACDYQGKYVLSNIHKTWNEAKVMCEQAGLHLAKIRNAEEVAEMKSAMTYFLGPADEAWERWDKRNWIWTGGNDIAEEESTGLRLSVSRLLELEGVTMCHLGVTWVSPGCHLGVTMCHHVSPGCHLGVTWVSLCVTMCHLGVTWVSQGFHHGVTLVILMLDTCILLCPGLKVYCAVYCG